MGAATPSVGVFSPLTLFSVFPFAPPRSSPFPTSTGKLKFGRKVKASDFLRHARIGSKGSSNAPAKDRLTRLKNPGFCVPFHTLVDADTDSRLDKENTDMASWAPS
jgi:hypothetical protein